DVDALRVHDLQPAQVHGHLALTRGRELLEVLCKLGRRGQIELTLHYRGCRVAREDDDGERWTASGIESHDRPLSLGASVSTADPSSALRSSEVLLVSHSAYRCGRLLRSSHTEPLEACAHE